MTTQPNILFIMADDHAANAISAYGSRLAKVFRTPGIDRLAAEGCRLLNCHCGNAICTPSRATILTGKYAHANGVKTLDDILDPDSDTYPRMFQGQGYQTALFGKWHVHSEPQGFDDYCVLPGQGVYFNPEFVRKGQFQWERTFPRDIGRKERSLYPLGEKHSGYVTDLVTDLCLDWLEKRDPARPFLLMCHHKAPHGQFRYHPRDEHLFDGVAIPEPASLWEDKSHRSDGSRDYGTTVSERNLRNNYVKKMIEADYPTGPLRVTGLNSRQRTQAAYQKYLKDYLRTVKAIDDNVTRLLDYLDRQGLSENTLVIYTSDQGMFLGEHDYVDKRWIYEEAMRMPFLIRYPREIAAGTVADSLIGNVDFAPTLLEFAGIAVPAEMQGRSFREILRGREPGDWPEAIYYRYWMHMTHHDNPAHYGIRTKQYKLIYFYGLPLDATGALDYVTPEGWELYDLQKDPEEVNNVWGKPQYKDVVVDLLRRLREMKEAVGDSDSKYPEMLALKQGIYGGSK